ncbi:MAG TPA: phosphopantetheine-binding protein, partial [Leptolinea sp.]
LTNLVNNILEGKPHYSVALNPNAKKDSDRQFREAVTQLCVIGLDLQNYDPYCLPEKVQTLGKKSPISVKLNGGLYLSEKTRTAFQNAINENSNLHLSAGVQTNVIDPILDRSIPEKKPEIQFNSMQTNPNSETQNVVNQIQKFQQDILSVHSKFLENDAEYTRMFSQLTQQELGLLSSNPQTANLEQINIALQTLDRSLTLFHQHQADTLRLHEQYLQSQNEFLSQSLGITTTSSKRVIEMTSPIPEPVKKIEIPDQKLTEILDMQKPITQKPGDNGNGHHVQTAGIKSTDQNTMEPSNLPVKATGDLSVSLLEIVSEKTGYPTEMLDLDMDMEADLGIDSIKRVEILGAMQVKFPELPKADAAALAEMKTLGQIVEYMSASPALPVAEIKAPIQENSNPVVFENTRDNSQADSISTQEVSKALLAIVSEKTGYPTEMLELGMDMEADLGIDSIKRVEILGAMQEKFPELPKADATLMAEMHTLQQIIDNLSGFNKTAEQSAEPQFVTPSSEKELTRGFLSLKSLPMPDRLAAEIPTNYITLLVDDGSELTINLAHRLENQKHKVVILGIPETQITRKSGHSLKNDYVKLNEGSETAVHSAIQEVEAKFGKVAVFIQLDPLNSGEPAFSEKEKAVVKTTFLLAKFLKVDLTEAAKKGLAAFLTVTHLDGQFGLSSTEPMEPVSGGLFGLTKTLNLEWDDVFCRAIDLQPDLPDEIAAENIIAELYDPNRLLTEVSYTDNGRYTLVVELPELEGGK